jgi:stage III sporulation protein SpoIIIAA
MCRLLSSKSNVVIVDTKNELSGNGHEVHSSVGLSRRVMVPAGSLAGQSQAMMEALQNHCPHAMVVDELRVTSESEAQISQMCKQQNIRLIASAGGNLRTVVQETMDPCIRSSIVNHLVGGLYPIFDCVVEIHNRHEWRVVVNTADAVAQIRRGTLFTAQQRTRDPNTGEIQLDMVRM